MNTTLAAASPLSNAPASREQRMRHFLDNAGWEGAALHPLAGDASFRHYIRVQLGHQQAMLMDAPPEKEKVRPYLEIARFLRQCGYSAPHILAEDVDHGFLLLEDLGDDLFTLLLNDAAAGISEESLYRPAIALLAQWHTAPELMRTHSTLHLQAYDRALLMQEASLFSDWYMPAALGKEAAGALRGEYLNLWEQLLDDAELAEDHFVHRDFHASNLMWLDGRAGLQKIGLLDFQDAVWGDPAYDLVSLLEDARRDVPPALAGAMLQEYITQTGCDATSLRTRYALLGAQRNCKIIGIFVRLWMRDGKRHYLPLLPRVWSYLQGDLDAPHLKPLKDWMDQHIPASARGEQLAHA